MENSSNQKRKLTNCNESHKENLYPTANDGGEKSGVSRGSKNVTVDQFPASFFQGILDIIVSVIFCNVSTQRSHHDHCEDAWKQAKFYFWIS
jgi:hypothetical protein